MGNYISQAKVLFLLCSIVASCTGSGLQATQTEIINQPEVVETTPLVEVVTKTPFIEDTPTWTPELNPTFTPRPKPVEVDMETVEQMASAWPMTDLYTVKQIVFGDLLSIASKVYSDAGGSVATVEDGLLSHLVHQGVFVGDKYPQIDEVIQGPVEVYINTKLDLDDYADRISLPSIPWQRYRMRIAIQIDDVGKLWMPVPREWDGVGMTDVQILEFFPAPTDHYRDNAGNEMVFWQIYDRSSNEYGMVFEISVQPIVYDIDVNNIAEYDTESDLYQRYTTSSEWIQSDNPEITALAHEIVSGETNPYRQAQLLHKWVATNISGGEKARNALEVLHTRKCGCDGYSFLFVALLRALSIPARTVKGWHTADQGVFTNGSARTGSFHQHHWSELYLQGYGWLQDDTTGSYDFINIHEPRIITAKGEDIRLGHGYPIEPIPWFNAPQANIWTPSTPPTQTYGDDFTLEVERLD